MPLTEETIIHYIAQHFPDYIGSDTAALRLPEGKNFVVSKDLLIENIHFRCSYVSPESLACKALQANLSDIAANGAKPRYIMLGLSIPKQHSRYAFDFIKKLVAHCKAEAIEIVGGDTTASDSAFFISITVFGESESCCRKTRFHARSGDSICVVGSLGYAHLGLLALENTVAGLEMFKQHFLFPQAKVEEGLWLGTAEAVSAMMDISDGLLIDLQRLIKASGVAGNIDLANIALPDEFQQSCRQLGVRSWDAVLTGGEDYGLLFTVNKAQRQALAEAFQRRFGYALTYLGQIEPGEGLVINVQGKIIEGTFTSFTHPF